MDWRPCEGMLSYYFEVVLCVFLFQGVQQISLQLYSSEVGV